LVADLAPPNDETYYRGVKRVPPGHYVLISRDQTVTRRYWEPPLRQLRLPSDDDYVEAFRERVNHAVRARLRGAGPTVATHLSAGYDSGTVTATAAALLRERDGRVLAYTSAPRVGYRGEVPRGRIADEVPYAALTASRHANIEHVVIRSDGTSQLDLLDEQHGLVQYPLGQLSNNLWWTAINRSARERGATVLLTGQVGNLGMSAGNLSSLADFIREGRLLHWWRESWLLVARGPARWRGVLANSFGPWMPRRVWRTINSRFAGSSPHVQTPARTKNTRQQVGGRKE
jgi:asparagine synthase (glutamine-hydrolysing)